MPTAFPGLTQAEAERRLAAEGENLLPSGGSRSFLAIARSVATEPMLALLIAAGLIYLALGDMHEALVLLAFAGLTVVITLVQEARTERAIQALGELSAPQARVLRDGVRMAIPARSVVRGDILELDAGDRIAADGWIVSGQGLQADEGLLTGESVPVAKVPLTGAKPDQSPAPGGDGLAYAFAGTLTVSGSGLMQVTATGSRSRMGAIGLSLASLERQSPRLRVQTRRLVQFMAAFGLAVSLLAVLLYGLLRGGWLEASLAGIALGMSMLPEELPVVLTMFMAMGALRMSRARVLTRRGAAIEALGAATVLCTDKTGTLTQNRMEVVELRLADGSIFSTRGQSGQFVPDEYSGLATLGILSSLERPVDPMEIAFHELGSRLKGDLANRQSGEDWKLTRQYGLSPELMAVSHAWRNGAGDELVIAAKGAPEAIAELCGMQPDAVQALEQAANEMAARGLRVLGIAEASWIGGNLPESQHQFDFTWRGLAGLADPVRPSAPGAVRQLQQAGIRIVMITGDYPATALAIAGQVGIAPGAVMTGAQLDDLDDAELGRQIGRVAIFARSMPEQKLRIVQALKTNGEIVAMTGDGVNDAPSLKAADIGIAMGQRGTDVAREASSIVLLEDDFASIAAAVRLGRRIYDNLRKAMGFIFAVHAPIGGIALLPLVAGWPIILGPMHIALLEMVIDPICSLAFEAEPEERDIMNRPPRPPQAPLFPRVLIGWSILQGLVGLAMLILLAAWLRHTEAAETVLRSTVFAALISIVLVLVAINRGFSAARRGRNLTLAILLGAAAAVFLPIFGSASVAGLFRLSPLDGMGMVSVAMVAACAFVLLSLFKRHFHTVMYQ
ncbi:MAG: cation-translocating P-type ATPase [Novosphingobium sp.]